jgi:hypothetical protein
VKKIKYAVFASSFFFVALLCWAFSAPIGAGPDSDFHISSIWCGQGERKGLCEEIGASAAQYNAKVPFMFQMCDNRPIEYLPSCAEIVTKPETQFLRTAIPLQQNSYYKIMSHFASQNTNQSVLVIRSINALIASCVLLALLVLCSGKIKFAVAASWSVGLVPVGVQFLSSVNPRGWSFLAVFSSWAFLASGLEARQRTVRSYSAYLLCALTASLAFATRVDGSIFVIFSCTIVTISHLLKNYVLSKKILIVSAISILLILVPIQSISSLSHIFSFQLADSIELPRFLLMQIVHGPEFITQAWGYNIGQQGNGPGIVGIIGLSLFVITLSFALQNVNPIQALGVVSIILFMIVSHMRGSLAIGELIPASGEYVMALTVFLLGFTLWTSRSIQNFQSSRRGQITTISLLTFSHAIAFYSYMEYYVKRGAKIGTFETISLNQSWWWNSDINPNSVYWIGSAAFSMFLCFMWTAVNQPSTDEQ